MVAILEREDGSLEAVPELIVFELYRREAISRGRAAELLRMPLYDFIKRASSRGIPYFNISPEELDAEVALLNSLTTENPAH